MTELTLIDKDYDRYIILGTLWVIIKSNEPAYDAHFGANHPEFQDLIETKNSISRLKDGDAFGIVKKILLQTAAASGVAPDIPTVIILTIKNGDNRKAIQITFDNKANKSTYDKPGFIASFEQNFINLAQVFYECGFGGTITEGTLNGAPISNVVINAMNSQLGTMKTKLSEIKKNLSKKIHLIYCSGAKSFSRFKSDDFEELNNIKFDTNFIPGRCVPGIVGYINKYTRSNHTIVFLDEIVSTLVDADLEKFADLFEDTGDRSLDIIIYQKDNLASLNLINRKNVSTTMIFLGKLDPGHKHVESIMFRGTDVKQYNFDYEVVTPNSKIKIPETLQKEDITDILEYFLFSKLVVNIRSIDP
jgi:hypothetical protein